MGHRSMSRTTPDTSSNSCFGSHSPRSLYQRAASTSSCCARGSTLTFCTADFRLDCGVHVCPGKCFNLPSRDLIRSATELRHKCVVIEMCMEVASFDGVENAHGQLKTFIFWERKCTLDKFFCIRNDSPPVLGQYRVLWASASLRKPNTHPQAKAGNSPGRRDRRLQAISGCRMSAENARTKAYICSQVDRFAVAAQRSGPRGRPGSAAWRLPGDPDQVSRRNLLVCREVEQAPGRAGGLAAKGRRVSHGEDAGPGVFDLRHWSTTASRMARCKNAGSGCPSGYQRAELWPRGCGRDQPRVEQGSVEARRDQQARGRSSGPVRQLGGNSVSSTAMRSWLADLAHLSQAVASLTPRSVRGFALTLRPYLARHARDCIRVACEATAADRCRRSDRGEEPFRC